MHKSNYELNVLVNGKPVREYYHNNRFFIEAKNGTEYSLKLKNHSHKKIMAVISVDGIDVLKGKTAVEVESGYIVNPYSSINIQGYRIDDNNVATFKFSDGKTSYATQVEQKFDEEKLEQVKKGEIAPARNNGVIGIRIWEEKEPMVIPEWKENRNNKNYFYASNSPFGSLSFITGGISIISGSSSQILLKGIHLYSGSSLTGCMNINSATGGYVGYTNIMASRYIPNYTPSFELGTSWGQKQEDKVIKVQFQKADTYIDLEIFYLIREELVKMGVDLEKSKKVFISGFPEAFAEKEEYCKQPTDWGK